MMSFLVTLLIHQRKALSVINKSKLGHKWTHEKVDKASNETISKKYAEYKQREPIEKGEKTGKALAKHVINLYTLLEFLNGLKSRMLKNCDRTLRMTQSLKMKWRI